jgi:hypothetical protein
MASKICADEVLASRVSEDFNLLLLLITTSVGTIIQAAYLGKKASDSGISV